MPGIQRIARILIRFSGKLLVIMLVLALLFATIAGVQDEKTLSVQSMRVGVNATLMLLTQMEPPRIVLKNPSVVLVVFGWFICVLGWLIVPLLVGVIVDVGMGGQQNESELRVRLYRCFLDAGVSPAQLDAAVEETVTRMRDLGRKG